MQVHVLLAYALGVAIAALPLLTASYLIGKKLGHVDIRELCRAEKRVVQWLLYSTISLNTSTTLSLLMALVGALTFTKTLIAMGFGGVSLQLVLVSYNLPQQPLRTKHAGLIQLISLTLMFFTATSWMYVSVTILSNM